MLLNLEGWYSPKEAAGLEPQSLVAFFALVDKEVTVEEFPGDEVLNAKLLQSYPDQAVKGKILPIVWRT